MKNIVAILIIIILSTNLSLESQTNSKQKKKLTQNDLALIPQEKIFVHLNSSFLLSGENLYYKIYCLNTQIDKLSNISKIAYVELIESNNKIVFKHKVRLESGLGKGDFFLTADIASGSYKIIAYTQWMKNGGIDIFFQGDINIINPFQKNNRIILNDGEFNEMQVKNETIAIENNLENHPNNKHVSVSTNGQTFSKRDKVILKTSSLLNEKSFGNFSISVRKIDTIIKIYNKLTATNYVLQSKLNLKPKNLHKNSLITFLPELRGELLSGKIISKNNKNYISNKKVALSILGKYPVFMVANTNASGVFHFNLQNRYKNSEALFQVFEHTNDDYKIELIKSPPLDYSKLFFKPFKITSKVKDLLLERSINNQIENAFNSIKANSIDNLRSLPLFFPTYGYGILEYDLDDYTRFPTLKETIVEVVNNVWISNQRGNYTFHIREGESAVETEGFPPLVLIDGILIQNHNELIDFNANNIKTISIVRDKYIYGSKVFGGILSIKTIKGDANFSNDYLHKIKLFKPESSKSYFKQEYISGSIFSRIPDYRTQLLWLPNFKLDNKEKIVEFFTSDNSGDYEISLEGFTNEGEPVSLREIITVK